MKKLLLIIPILMILNASSVKAADVWTMAQSEKYGQKTGGMLGRGLVNIVTCFVDVIVATVDGTKNGPPFIGTVTGLGKGIGCTTLRVLSGALDVVTFWVPGFNGYPVCKSYVDCINCGVPVEAAAPVYQAPTYQAPAPVVYQQAAPAPVQDENPMRYVKK